MATDFAYLHVWEEALTAFLGTYTRILKRVDELTFGYYLVSLQINRHISIPSWHIQAYINHIRKKGKTLGYFCNIKQ